MSYRLTIITTLTLGCLINPAITFANETETIIGQTTQNIDLTVAHSLKFNTTITVNNIKYPVSVTANWIYKPYTPTRNYLSSNKIKKDISDYLTAHTKNENNLEAVTYNLAYNMLDDYSQLQSFTVTLNILATDERIVSDYSSVTASYHK